MPESTPPARQNRATRRAAKARLRRTEAQRTASLAPAATDRVAAIEQDLRQALGPAAVEHLPTGAIRSNPRNARRHSRKQIEQLADSLRAFGFLCPVIIDEAEQLLAGHGRLVAAKSLGLATVPCLRVQHLTPEAKRAFALADNRLAELSDWDEDLLKAELEELAALEADLTFSLEVTGFDTVDLDRLLGPEPSPTGRRLQTGSRPIRTMPSRRWRGRLSRDPVTCGRWAATAHYAGMPSTGRAMNGFSRASGSGRSSPIRPTMSPSASTSPRAPAFGSSAWPRAR